MNLSYIISSIINAIYPPKCIVCDSILDDGRPICIGCNSAINWLNSDFFSPELARPAFDSARSLAAYDGCWAEVIHRFKYNNRTDLARPLAIMMADKIDFEYDVVTAVPLHPKRLRERGYNQSALLVKEVARLTGFKVNITALKRIKETVDQVGLSKRERLENVKGAFALYSSSEALAESRSVGLLFSTCLERSRETSSNSKSSLLPFGKDILLIDDVMTTGATVNECAKVLKKSGAERVDVLTLARTVI